MFEYIYKKLYILGLFTARYITRFSRRLIRFLAKPVKALGALLSAVVLVLDRFVLGSVKAVTGEVKELFGEARAVSTDIKDSFKKSKKQGAGVLSGYVKKAFAKHGLVFSVLTNVVTPVLALVVLLSVLHYWNSMKLGLKITYNNAEIGCVDNEVVYLNAQDKATQRLQTAIAANEGETLIKTAQYKIVPVKFTDLSDSEAICNRIIERSDSNITNACGIYIDGEFLCAVKNESDGVTVFDNILSAYNANEGDIVSFVEDISYVQGMYPDNENTVWDAAKLADKLATKKSEAVYYTVAAGDTISGIAQKFGISTAKVYELNPSVAERIHVGDSILISSDVNFVRVQVTRTEVRTVSIPYQTVKVENASLYKGVNKTVQKGSNGEQQVTELVTYIDGVRVSVKEVSRVTTREPVSEKIQVGTKAYASSRYSSTVSYSSGGSVTSYGGRFVWPAIGAYSVSSGFGGRRNHGGIDIVKPGGNSTGATIVAAAGGTVVSASYHGSWGYNVLIDHGNGLSTRYAHMMPGSMKVSAGQHVSAGQPIGNIGSSGNVTGPHLHFEVYVGGRRVNPMGYLGR
jgi:murein DD-endopeptidase MepM/ murein hydrolase activator NlpD